MDADRDALDERLRAVERTVADPSESDGSEPPAASALRDRLDGFAERLDAVEERLDGVDAETQALRGAVAGLDAGSTAEAETRADGAASRERERQRRPPDPSESRRIDPVTATDSRPCSRRWSCERVDDAAKPRREATGEECGMGVGQHRGVDAPSDGRRSLAARDPGRAHPIPQPTPEDGDDGPSLLGRLLGR